MACGTRTLTTNHPLRGGGGNNWEEESLYSSNCDDKHSVASTTLPEGGDAADRSQPSASSQFGGTLNGTMLDYGSTLQQDMDYDIDFVVEPSMDNTVPDKDGDSIHSPRQGW
jgi:hypothetical protein